MFLSHREPVSQSASIPSPESAEPEMTANAESSARSLDEIWREVRDNSDIQYEKVAPDPPEEPPEWLMSLGRALNNFFGDIAPYLVSAWPFIRIFLIAALIVGVLILIWKIVTTFLHRESDEKEERYWQPDQQVARKLLDEADALAAQGNFDEAAHLLLYRSIEDIQRKRPQLLRPSNTAREIGHFEALSQGARETFGIIANHVEHSLFAAHPLDRNAWQESREAYGRFAFKGNWT